MIVYSEEMLLSVPAGANLAKGAQISQFTGNTMDTTSLQHSTESNRDSSCRESLIRFEILWEVHTGIYCVSNMVVLNVESTINVACGEGLFVP